MWLLNIQWDIMNRGPLEIRISFQAGVQLALACISRTLGTARL